MIKTKKCKYAAFITIFILALAIFSISNLYFRGNGQMERYFTDTDQYFFVLKLNDFNIIGLRSGSSIFNTKIKSIKKERFVNAGIFDENERLFYVLENDRIILYDFQGKLQCSYDYTDKGKEIISGCASNLLYDNSPKLLILTRYREKEYGDEVIIYSYDGKLKEAFRQSFKELNPWKVQTADVDGDGIGEISVGVYKTTKFHSVLAKRPFIYNWNGKEMSPKWLGSRLSRPFDDYIFLDIDDDKMDEIIAVETLQDGRKVLNSYKWKGFGFESMGEGESYTDICDLSVHKDNNLKLTIFARVKKNNKWTDENFSFAKDRIAGVNTKE